MKKFTVYTSEYCPSQFEHLHGLAFKTEKEVVAAFKTNIQNIMYDGDSEFRVHDNQGEELALVIIN